MAAPWGTAALSGWMWGERGFSAWHGHPKVPHGWSCSQLWECRDKLPGQLHSCPHPAGTPAGSGSACMLWGGCRGREPLSAVGTRAAALCGSSAAPRKYSLVGASDRDAKPGRSVPRVWGQHFEVGCRRRGRAAPPARPSCLKSQGIPAGAQPAQTPWCRAGGCRRSALGTPLGSGVSGGDARARVSSARSHSAAAPGTGAGGGGRPVPVSPEQGWGRGELS